MVDNFAYCVLWFLSYPILIKAVGLATCSLGLFAAAAAFVRG